MKKILLLTGLCVHIMTYASSNQLVPPKQPVSEEKNPLLSSKYETNTILREIQEAQLKHNQAILATTINGFANMSRLQAFHTNSSPCNRLYLLLECILCCPCNKCCN